MRAKRVVLLHAYRHSIAPIEQAMAEVWPQAEALNLLDEALYQDVDELGTTSPAMKARVKSLFSHCVLSNADGIIFTGSTFGPLVSAVRSTVSIPVLKADEAMAELAVRNGNRILVICTAERALPVISANIEAAADAAGTRPQIKELWIEGAKEAIAANDMDTHDRLVADAVGKAADFEKYDVIALGQLSMIPALQRLNAGVAERILTSATASARKIREMLSPQNGEN
jgi:Asp/Glu/hydantoin racemase